MLINFIYKDKLNTITLPKKRFGKHWVMFDGKKIISIDGEDDNWILSSNRKAKIKIDNNYYKKAYLKSGKVIGIDIEDEEALIYAENITEDRTIYEKYEFNSDGEITIGRDEDNTICYQNEYTSSHHAILTCHNSCWSIKDLDSINGIFINNTKCKEKTLSFGDVIFIMGLKIIVSNNFIAINNPDNKIKTSLEKMKYEKVNEDIDDEYEDNIIDINYFQRSPRFKKSVVTKDIKIDSPPGKEGESTTPFILTIAPSLTMGLSSAVTAIYTVINASQTGSINTYIPTLIVSFTMLIGSIVFPIISNVYQKRRSKKNEKNRQKKYSDYLDKVKQEIENEKVSQINILKTNYPTINDCQNRIINEDNSLWERNIYEDNFLEFRLGTGNRKLDCRISIPEKSFSLEEDILKDKMYEIGSTNYMLDNVPMTISFYKNYLTGIIGNKRLRFDFIKGLIYEIASQYSYDEVKMIFIYKDNKQFDFVKWLPHTFSKDRSFRFIATNIDEMKELSYFFESEFFDREDATKEDSKVPYYITFVLDKDLAQNSEFLNRIYNQKKQTNFSVINVYEKLEELPKDCSAIVKLDETSEIIYKDQSIENEKFNADIYLTTNPNNLAKKLANIKLNEEKTYQLPEMISFLQMYGVGKIEHLNIQSRWEENDPTKSLGVPVGIDSYGKTFCLDLHQKFHGPHGIIAGTTGSGKSEFIMTYILSLAVNFHPYEVQFILIDYKGGGMAAAFANLPHTSGIITNIDGSGISRALTSINSEIKRREKIFSNVTKKLGVTNVDIYKYQSLFREGKVLKPLPHLFIIADEFAELKQQLPDFMEELISISRIGRSLGVHLILATQKPSASVSQEIWSNSKFKICLKVQETQDSTEMLKRPEAAYLKETGRFYLLVGNNELFELGQSAWSGHKYIPNDKYEDEKDNSISIIDNNARVIKKVQKKNNNLFEMNKKEIDEIVEFINNISNEEKIEKLPIWLPILDDNTILDELIHKYAINKEKAFMFEPLIGEFDDPVNQKKDYLRINLNSKNTIVYGSNAESYELFLNTMIYSLINNHSSDELNLYLMDFGGQSLSIYEKAPQVGDIVLSSETEKVSNLFKTLIKEIEKRKKLFADYSGSYQNYLKESGNSIPNIIIIINNYASFRDYYEDNEDSIAYLSREGSKYGINFVISANASNVIRNNITQNFSQNIVLNMNDTGEYMYLSGSKTNLIPKHVIGRGIVRINDSIYEFQTAKITENNVSEHVKNRCLELSKIDKGASVTKIAVLPETITSDDMINNIKDNLEIPIGLDKASLLPNYLNIENNYITFVLSNQGEYLSFEKNLSNFIESEYKDVELTVVDADNKLRELNPNINYVSGNNSCNEFIDDFYNTILNRNNNYKDAIEKGEKPEDYPMKVIIINSLKNLLEGKDEISVEKISLALERGTIEYNVRVIIFEIEKDIKWFTNKKWFKTNGQFNETIWFGNNFLDQYTIVPNSRDREINSLVNNTFAIKIENGNTKLIKTFAKEEK